MILISAAFIALATLAQMAPSQASPEAKAKAQVLLKEGARLYEKGDLAESLEKFNQAYAEYASPKLLYNIGQASRGLGRLAEAMEAFEHFLDQTPDAPADMIADANKSVSELRTKLGRLRLECTMPEADVTVDGRPVGKGPIAVLLWALPGKHQVTARHASASPAVEDVEVMIGSVHNVVLQLRPSAESPVAAAPPLANVKVEAALPPPEPEAAPPVAMDQGWWLGRKWTWVAGGSAVAFAGAAAIVGSIMQSKFDSLNRSCGSENPSFPGCSDSEISSVKTRATTANVLWGLSGAALLTTGVLFFVEGHSIGVAPMAGQTMGLQARVAY
jgi:hypothetical protein